MGMVGGIRRRALVLATTVVLAACGGSGSGGPAATIKPRVADQLTADATVLQASDLTGSFQSSSSSDSNSSSNDHGEQAQTAVGCIQTATKIRPSSGDPVGKASRAYQSGAGLNAVEVGAEVDVYRDDSGLHEQLAAFDQPAVANCLKRAFLDTITAQGGLIREITVAPSKIEGLGDDQAGLVLSGPGTVNGVAVNFGAEFDFTRVGRIALTTTLVSFNGVPDHAIAVTAMTAMVNRLPT